ncbi:GNAT family N-acetyltransferase [Chryseobacterium binzhouense]|uniref:GNAT family N-acetyltransferase n=1 Tax=Chryseobacterium binzhouense TaxID=2593646 RepID=UPI0011805481|nr:GNAT family N-acetyltransferase [Chryseobacterium binzhouense]
MEIIKIENNTNDLRLLESFILNIGEARKKFRYFEKRSLNIIGNHIVTVLVLNEQIPIGYGHLDKDGDKIWLGIAILPSCQGKGIGNLIMEKLIIEAKNNKISEVMLTVDKDNLSAQNLYSKFNFRKIKDSEDVSFYKYLLTLKDE